MSTLAHHAKCNLCRWRNRTENFAFHTRIQGHSQWGLPRVSETPFIASNFANVGNNGISLANCFFQVSLKALLCMLNHDIALENVEKSGTYQLAHDNIFLVNMRWYPEKSNQSGRWVTVMGNCRRSLGGQEAAGNGREVCDGKRFLWALSDHAVFIVQSKTRQARNVSDCH